MTKAAPEETTTDLDAAYQDNTPDKPQDPFGGDSETFTVDKDVDASQFEDQVAEALGVDADTLMTSASTDAEGKTTVFIYSKDGLDRSKVQKVLKEHEPVVPVAPLTISTAPADDEVQALVKSLKDGETLTTKELSTVLKSLLA